MGRRATLQATFTKGELDPDLSERTDLEHYYDSAAAAPNSVFHPQGGVSDRGGFALVSDADVLASGTRRRLRRRIAPVHITGDNLTAVNGGTTPYLVDQDAATVFQTNACTAAVFVVVEIDLGVAQWVDLVDLVAFSAELAPSDNCLAVQYWTGAAWTTFADPLDAAPAKHIRTTARTRRFGTAPGGPGGVRISARNWRIVALNASGVIGRITIGGLRLWSERPDLGSIDVREVARATDASYELVVTERNVDVFESQRYVASIPLALPDQMIAELNYTGGFDTLLLFHEMLETPRIVRQGAAGEWDIGVAPVENVPDLKPQITFTGDQDEIQELTFVGLEPGDLLQVTLGDLIAAPLTFATFAGLPAQIVAALAALPGVDAAGVGATLSGAQSVTVRFTGANGARAWPMLSGLSPATVAVTTRIVQAGLLSTGKLFEARTGWPRAGAFVQQRLVLGGFRAAPTSLMFSRPNSWSFLDTSDPMTADLGFLRTLNADGIEIITQIFVGRHLQVFTEAGEWYAASQTFDATQAMAMIRVSSHGIRRAVPIAFADGASLFVQAGGLTLRDFLWKDAEQSYSAEPLTVLSPQILTDVVDVAHRSARSVTEGNLILLVNADGTAGCLTLLRGQNVVAGSPWSTEGAFKVAMCDVQHRLYAVTERAGEHWLELWTPDMPLDFATTVAGDGLTVITGAHHLEGRDDVWAIADDEVLGPFTVTAGAFALGLAADRVTYGLAPAWRLRPQVVREKINAETPFRAPGRIYEVELALKKTGHLTLGTNGGAHREVPILRVGDRHADGGPLQTEDGGAPGLPMMQRLYTGNVRISGLLGFSKTPFVELSRSVPSPVHVKSIRQEIAMKGGADG